MMTAITVPSPAPGAAMQLVQSDLGDPAPDQLRVAVTYAGVNYWDLMQRFGQVPLPASGVPGVEGVGRVQAVGADVDPSWQDRRVAWSKVRSSYAEQVQASWDWFLAVPDELPDEQAGALLMQGVTAQYLLEAAPTLEPGSAALVLAAAGGVGSLLTQLLVARGVEVCGVVSRAEKAAVAEQAGAAHVVLDEELVAATRARYPHGVQAVFDGNGGSGILRSFDVLADRGGLISFGTAGGKLPELTFEQLARGSYMVRRVAGKHYTADVSAWRARARTVLDLAVGGELRAFVDPDGISGDAEELHGRILGRRNRGKLLLDARALADPSVSV